MLDLVPSEKLKKKQSKKGEVAEVAVMEKPKKKKSKKDKEHKEVVVADTEVSKKKKKKDKKEKEASMDVSAEEGTKKKKKDKKKDKKKEEEVVEKKEKANGHANGMNGHANGSNNEGGLKKNFYKEAASVSAMTADEVAAMRKEATISISGNNSDIKPIRTFAETGLPADMLVYCKDFTKPTPIQSQCWPIILSGRDIIGIAETGSGKTLGFTLPALMHIRAQKPVSNKPGQKGPIMLVLSPTRELAMQTQEVCEKAGATCGLKSACIYGGMPKDAQKKALSQGVHIVVATPGRLLGLCREGVCSLSRVTYLVLDEADRMLDQGFEPDIRAIIAQVPVQRQTVMFSATWPLAIQALGKEFLQDPVHVTIGTPNELAANHRVKQTVEVIEDRARLNRLFELLQQYHTSRTNRVLIFVLYKKEVPFLESALKRKGWDARGISGDKSQVDRIQALQEFKDGKSPLLIATDVAARGLDIPNVEHVINYSFPLTIEDYVHRIGRTGRGGKTGNSHTFFQKFDKSMAGELVNILNEAGEPVPADLLKFGTGVKRKQHDMYGAHFKKDDERPMGKKVHMKF